MATEVLNSEQITKTFNYLETQKNLLINCTENWKRLTTHFTSLENSLNEKNKTLDSKIQTLVAQTFKSLESLTQRENSIPERESAAIALVEEQKQLGLLEFEKNVSGKIELGEIVKSLCRKMDSEGLLKFITAKRKDGLTLRSEIGSAVGEAMDSPRLVLDVVEEYIDKKDVIKVGLSDRRWACGAVISALFPNEEKTMPVAGKIAERALSVAEKWKVKIQNEEGSGGVGHVEAATFLQVVVGFGIVSKFDPEFLRKLVMENPSRRDMPKLASALGLGEKMGDIINELVKSGKEIDAVYFAYECDLTERFPPVDLLKNYLKNSKNQAATILKNNNHSSAAKENASNVELNSLKAIIKCVEDHKLEPKFPLESLRKRLSLLEKLKAEKRKSTSTPNKRARGNSGGGGSGSGAFRPTKFGRGSNSYTSYGHRNPGPAHRNPAAAYSGSYNYPGQAVYKGPPSSSYTAQYSRSPAALHQHYSLPPENVGGPGAQVTGSYGPQTNYGAYDYGTVAPSSYQAPYPQ
ncbi:hypothetical protein IFM89_024399 [Coptis chinensis]|uniref:FRIGIDA-like protein n=1 Tax=Coptis chinensis TaxID=261450 RepID=A0A835M9F3_9MAGN|nr:hypothetical protein IFM89_024399 [Coptis chinensis]